MSGCVLFIHIERLIGLRGFWLYATKKQESKYRELTGVASIRLVNKVVTGFAEMPWSINIE
jgi:hypothetical protein